MCSWCRLLVLPAPIKRDGEGQEVRRYLAYITTDKVTAYMHTIKKTTMKIKVYAIYIKFFLSPFGSLPIQVGLLLLPHDGNPHNSQCLIAHPRAVRLTPATRP